MITGLVPGLLLLLHPRYWALTGTPLKYPIVSLYHGAPAALDLQVQPMLQPDGKDVGVGYRTVLVLGLGHSWVGQPASFPLIITTQTSSPALPWLAHPV